MLRETSVKYLKDNVLVPSSIKMHIYGLQLKKLMQEGWQLRPGKVQEGFRYVCLHHVQSLILAATKTTSAVVGTLCPDNFLAA